MLTRRTVVNAIVFLIVSAGLIGFGFTRFLLAPTAGHSFTVTLGNAGGLLPRSDVTVRGVPAGSVRSVDLRDDGRAEALVVLRPGERIPEGSVVEITRRSPIGDITMNIVPGDGPPVPDGGGIPMEDTIPLPEAERTIEVLAQVLSAVPPEDLDTLVHELSVALDGRGDDLGTLARSGADLAERLAGVRGELHSLIEEGSLVLDVLADNAPTLGDDIFQTALLADILRDRRFDLVDLSRGGADLAQVLGELVSAQKANLSCLVSDFGELNELMMRPRHRRNLIRTLELNHFFFDGVRQTVQPGKDGFDWFRVHFLTPQSPPAQPHVPHRPPPDVHGGNACRSQFGQGVGPGTQRHDPALVEGSRLRRGR